MTPESLLNEINVALRVYAPEGASQNPTPGAIPALSHLCFKFKSEADYRTTIQSAQNLGAITLKEFGGKEITWCRLSAPILSLEWLELVQPKTEANAYNGLTAIGYAVPALKDVVKIQSKDGKITFRYQPLHAKELAQ